MRALLARGRLPDGADFKRQGLGEGRRNADIGAVNILSILIGLVALPGALIALVPLLGWLYWLVVPVGLVGLACGVLSRRTSGRTLNLIVIVVGVVRLAIGHGIV